MPFHIQQALLRGTTTLNVVTSIRRLPFDDRLSEDLDTVRLPLIQRLYPLIRIRALIEVLTERQRRQLSTLKMRRQVPFEDDPLWLVLDVWDAIHVRVVTIDVRALFFVEWRHAAPAVNAWLAVVAALFADGRFVADEAVGL